MSTTSSTSQKFETAKRISTVAQTTTKSDPKANKSSIFLGDLDDKLLKILSEQIAEDFTQHQIERAAFVLRTKQNGIPKASLAGLPDKIPSYLKLPGFDVPYITTEQLEILKRLSAEQLASEGIDN